MPWTKDQFEPDCVTALEAAWDEIMLDCPEDDEQPTTEDITRIMCSLALADGFKGHAVKEMCVVMEKEFPWMKLEPNCHVVLEGMVDNAALKCDNVTGVGSYAVPESSTTTLTITTTSSATGTETTTTSATGTSFTTVTPTPAPTPPAMTDAEIERLVCTTATQAQIAGRHYGDVCSRINKVAAWAADRFQPDCLVELNARWDTFADICPHGSQTVARSRYEREQLICTFSTKRQIQGVKVKEVCTQMNASLPWISFDGECVGSLKDVWDDAAEKCPYGHEVIPNLEDLQKLACTFGTHEEIKSGSISKVCKRIGKKLPWLKFATECHPEMKSIWEHVETKCPLGAETVPVPEDYTKLACSLATPQQIRVGDSGGVCSAILSELPWLKFDPDCQTLLDNSAVFGEARMRCPQGRETAPSPYEIVKLTCTAASAAQVASKSLSDVCRTMHIQVPWVVEVFDPDCPTVLEPSHRRSIQRYRRIKPFFLGHQQSKYANIVVQHHCIVDFALFTFFGITVILAVANRRNLFHHNYSN